MTAKKSAVWAAALLALAVGCQTGRQKAVPEPETGAQPVSFQPGAFLAPIRHEQGRYADLFSPSSYALWVGPEVMMFKQEMAKEAGETVDPRLAADADQITRDFLVLECHIESAFSDSSIAYDVVGFRGIDAVYLLLPDGRKIRPEQTVIGRGAEEDSKGALKVFRRTNLLVFPTRDLWSGGATLDPGAPSVRLVLDGYESRFYFEWPAAPGTVAPQRWAPTAEEAKQAIKLGFTQLYTGLRQLAHLFD